MCEVISMFMSLYCAQAQLGCAHCEVVGSSDLSCLPLELVTSAVLAQQQEPVHCGWEDAESQVSPLLSCHREEFAPPVPLPLSKECCSSLCTREL